MSKPIKRTDREIIHQALMKAGQNGYLYPKNSMGRLIVNSHHLGGKNTAQQIWTRGIITSREFARAFWGEASSLPGNFDLLNGAISNEEFSGAFGWKHHLRELVVSDDPIRYLEAFL